MAINFPDSPAENDSFTSGGKKWIFNGTVWTLVTANSYTIPTGEVTTAKILDANVTAAKLASGAAVANIGYTPANIASPTFTGTVVLPSTTSIGTVTNTEIGYVDGVTSAIQTQLDSKLTATTDTTSNRNVIINGAMQVAQRGTTATGVAGGGAYVLADRWRFGGTLTTARFTATIEADYPSGYGFARSLKMLVTTAESSLSTGTNFPVDQLFEGQNLQHFAKGTALAKPFTLSFWVKSNVTGTYIARLLDSDNSRSCAASYTVNASATWEKKTITFPADTTGVLDNDNANSLRIQFYLCAGSTFTSGTLNTSWESSVNANIAVGQTNLAAATSNYWQITGVQLEAGAVATPFEFEDYGTTLAKCQRYYTRYTAGVLASTAIATSTTVFEGTIPLIVAMRTTPTTLDSSATRLSDGAAIANTATLLLNASNSSSKSVYLTGTVASGLTAFRPYFFSTNGGYYGFSAEL